MHKGYLVAGAVFGAVAVALGAFGAHGLEKMTGDEKVMQGFRTAVNYQMYHALALLAVAIMFEKVPAYWLRRAATCFISGIFLFSGSLYLLTFLKIQGSDFLRWVGPVTPAGGLLLIAGWICLLLAARKQV